MSAKPYPQPVLIRLSDVSDVGTSTAHRTAYITTTLPAIVQGLRNLECQPDPFNEFQGPDALLDDLLSILSGMEAQGIDRGALVRAALCQEITRREDAERQIATLTRERDEANKERNSLRTYTDGFPHLWELMRTVPAEGKNYVEFSVHHEGIGDFCIEIIRKDRKSPHELRRDAEAERDLAIKERDQLRETIRTLTTPTQGEKV